MQAFIEHQQQSMQKIMEEASQKQAEQEAIVDQNTSVTENIEPLEQATVVDPDNSVSENK